MNVITLQCFPMKFLVVRNCPMHCMTLSILLRPIEILSHSDNQKTTPRYPAPNSKYPLSILRIARETPFFFTTYFQLKLSHFGFSLPLAGPILRSSLFLVNHSNGFISSLFSSSSGSTPFKGKHCFQMEL